MFPPKSSVFSIKITLTPFSCAAIAEVNPAPPAPITTTSASFGNSTAFAFCPVTAVRVIPLFLTASSIASLVPSLVIVAPEIPSTSKLWVAITFLAISWIAGVANSDSFALLTFTSVILLSFISTSRTIPSLSYPNPVPSYISAEAPVNKSINIKIVSPNNFPKKIFFIVSSIIIIVSTYSYNISNIIFCQWILLIFIEKNDVDKFSSSTSFTV